MWECAKQWAQIAPGVTPIVALSALLIAWWQLAVNRANQRENTAKATFREYLKLAVQYPELSWNNYESLTGDDLERYKWLVGYFLWSAEELLEYTPREDVWRRNLEMLAGYHREYLKSPDFMSREFETYSGKTKELIKRVVKSG
jgi:hypothetical protein